MATVKQKQGWGFALMVLIALGICGVACYYVIFKWQLKEVANYLVSIPVLLIGVPLIILIHHWLQPYLYHDNNQFSRLIYRVRRIEGGKEVGEQEAAELEERLLGFIKMNPGFESEGYRILGDLNFATMQTDKSMKYYAKDLTLLPHDSDEYMYVFNRYAAGMLRVGAYAEALREFELLAETKPFYSIGSAVMHEFGWGVKPDLREAIRLYGQAMRSGNDLAVMNYYEAQWRLSHPVPKLDKDGYAEYMFKCHDQEGYKAGVPALTASAEAGYAPSQFELGTLYMGGQLGKNKLSEAFHWLRRGADQNYPPALHNLGFLVQMRCMDPIKGNINKPKIPGTFLYSNQVRITSAIAGGELIQKAADAGYPPSQHSVGATCLREGYLDEAKLWLKRAADQGFKKAQDDYKAAFGSI